MKRNLSAISDIAFYIVIPLIIWNLRGFLHSDYIAMLLSVSSSVSYTIIRFVLERQFNFSGFFIVSVLSAFMLMNIVSSNAISIQYNNIILNIFIILFYIGSILIKKPCGKYFYRDLMKEFGNDPGKFESASSYNGLTIVFALRDFIIVIIRFAFLYMMGMHGIKYIIPITRIVTYIFILVIIKMMKKMSSSNTKKEGA